MLDYQVKITSKSILQHANVHCSMRVSFTFCITLLTHLVEHVDLGLAIVFGQSVAIHTNLIGDSLDDTLKMEYRHHFKVGVTFNSHIPFSCITLFRSKTTICGTDISTKYCPHSNRMWGIHKYILQNIVSPTKHSYGS